MPYFDRFDICEAHYCLEVDYHVGGWLRERASNVHRNEATHIQLRRLRFRPRPSLSTGSLTENGRVIYAALCVKYGFREGVNGDT